MFTVLYFRIPTCFTGCVVTVLIPAPVDATGDATGADSVALALHLLFAQWLGNLLEATQALDGMPRLEDLTAGDFAQMRERYFPAFLQQTPEAWDLLPDDQRQACVQQRTEATCSLLSQLSGDAGDFDPGDAFAELQDTFQTLEDIGRTILNDPVLDEWQRRPVKALLDDAERLRDGPFQHLSTLPGSGATDGELDYAKRCYLGARVHLRRLLRRASLLAQKLQRASSGALRKHARDLHGVIRRGRVCITRTDRRLGVAFARDRLRDVPERSPARAPTAPGSTSQPILSNAPPPRHGPARTLATAS